ncbi:MAG: hypothetical protein LYZ66_00200 [Nitrososphaerales archaeon]|nr:hypothetical protein [Nitrososphaerales archaeon]
MAHKKRVTTIDEKHRVSIGREAIEESGVKKGERLLVIPVKGGIILETRGAKRFTESLSGFAFEESKREATGYLKRLVKSAGS